MVLDNASATAQSDSFSDTAPANDVDAYSNYDGGNPNGQNYHIDMAGLPQPVPILGPLVGWNQFMEKMIGARLAARSKEVNRPFSQEEATAQAFWVAKQISIMSYAAPIGVIGGLWRSTTTKDTFRFPFWQPNPDKFQPSTFPPKYPMLAGGRAIMAWHILRGIAYGYVGREIAKVFIGGYSVSVSTVGELSDPRLKEINKVRRQNTQGKRGALGQSKPVGGTARTGGTTQTGTVAAGRSQQQDDASPTGGMYFDESAAQSTMEVNRTDNDQQDRGWSKKDQSQLSKAPPVTAVEVPDQQFGEFDDASPTSGENPRAGSAPEQDSAWERVRKGSNSPGGQTTRSWPVAKSESSARQSGQSAWSKYRENNQQEQQSASGESFTFSKSEEERSLAKGEAQREFDARVERERKGGDFNSRGDDQKRW